MNSVFIFQGNKIIIITNRYSTVEKCHKLYNLTNIKIIDSGKPSEI